MIACSFTGQMAQPCTHSAGRHDRGRYLCRGELAGAGGLAGPDVLRGLTTVFRPAMWVVVVTRYAIGSVFRVLEAHAGPFGRNDVQLLGQRWPVLGLICAVMKISIPAEKTDSPVTATATWSVRPSSRRSIGAIPGKLCLLTVLTIVDSRRAHRADLRVRGLW